ncbi:hypothetical protein CEP52_006572 [Fusarium oligoseptatum]|uniref:Uncharacterized protein n=1 Tax=Fusarium oligoseptatum TaxID=2604345 RepID=A0A428TSB0_9HYPO|nr:hypothetical protein CEP52_006572 [Fusarium oligoseptatum]
MSTSSGPREDSVSLVPAISPSSSDESRPNPGYQDEIFLETANVRIVGFSKPLLYGPILGNGVISFLAGGSRYLILLSLQRFLFVIQSSYFSRQGFDPRIGDIGTLLSKS